jgi:hypothetical protein
MIGLENVSKNEETKCLARAGIVIYVIGYESVA